MGISLGMGMEMFHVVFMTVLGISRRGQPVEVNVESRELLIYTLRERLARNRW